VKFQGFNLDQSRYLLIKRSCTSACENIDDTQHEDLQYAFCSQYYSRTADILEGLKTSYF